MAPKVTTAGLARVAAAVLADTPYAAVGTGTTAPAAGDTTLEAETDRVAVTTQVQTGAQAEWRTFFPNADLPTTVEEVGLFLNSSATPDAATLLVRALSSFTKGSQDLYLAFKVTFQEG